MSAVKPALTPEVVAEDPSVVEDRRLRVQAMRLRRLSVKAIAAVLNESEETIQADIDYLAEQHRSRFGPAPTVDPAQEIGWAVADFEEMEAVAWLEFHSLKQEAQQRKLSPMFVARARQGWIRTAAMMRVLRLKLLAEHGYLLPQASRLTAAGAQIPTAEALRSMLRAEGLLTEVEEGARARLAQRPEWEEREEAREEEGMEVARWLDDGGFVGLGEAG